MLQSLSDYDYDFVTEKHLNKVCKNWNKSGMSTTFIYKMRVEFLTLSGVRRAGSLGSRTQQVRVGYLGLWALKRGGFSIGTTNYDLLIYATAFLFEEMRCRDKIAFLLVGN